LIGGANVKNQIEALKETKPQIVIATPGRLAEMVFHYEKLSLNNVNTIIIDEADQTLQDPFYNEIKTMIEASPFMKQKLMLSSQQQQQPQKLTQQPLQQSQQSTSSPSSATNRTAGSLSGVPSSPSDSASTSFSSTKQMFPFKKYVLCLCSATANNNPTVTQFMEDYAITNTFHHIDNQNLPISPLSHLLMIKGIDGNNEEEEIIIREAEISKMKIRNFSIPTSSVSTIMAKEKLSHVKQSQYIKAIVKHASMIPSTITHGMIAIQQIKFYEVLRKLLLSKPTINRGLIFVNDPQKVEALHSKLTEMGFVSAPLTGDTSKDDRKEILTRIRDGRLRLVVTTELAARGLDIPDVTHIINFELPHDALRYVHR
jgi:superfamily II DNA/RNA helicase